MQARILLICLPLFVLCSCSVGGESSSSKVVPDNVVPLVVDRGYNGLASNTSFITLTVCIPNTNDCQVLDHVFVDTGSTGLRINQSALNINLRSINFYESTIYQCMKFGEGYTFGPAATADVRIGGETAKNIPVQVFNDVDHSNVPTDCSNGLPFADLNNFGAKAIVGVNPYSNPNNNYTGVYTCRESQPCAKVENPREIPVQLNLNPVVAFSKDNNGLIINLPPVNFAESSALVGYMVFGLDTQNNNQVNSSPVKVLGSSNPDFQVGYFHANSNSLNSSYAIFDSGYQTYYFYDANMAQCTLPNPDGHSYYCPNSFPQYWSSRISSYNSADIVGEISALIINYEVTLGLHDTVVPGLGEVASQVDNLTIYGLPFFFGKRVYIGLMGESGNQTPLGIGPAWGYESSLN